MEAQKLLNDLNAGMEDLAGKLPRVMGDFDNLRRDIMSAGLLGEKQKELIAVGIAVAIRSPYCIAIHVNSALQLGATGEEILEAVAVAVLMGGGPSVAYGVEAAHALRELTTDKTS